MDWLKNPIFSYVGMAIAFAAIIFGVVKPEYASYAWTVAGFLGFGSIDLLRTFIDSQGWKTHAIFVVVGVGSLLQIFGVIDLATYQMIVAAFAPLIGVTMQQALAKSTASVPKVGE